MRELLKKYRLSDVKAIAANGDTILHLVVQDESFTAQKKLKILKILLEYGLDLRSTNKKQETVLHLAIKTKARDVIDFLLTRKFVLDSSAARYFIQIECDRLFKLNNESTISDDKMQEEENESTSFLKWMMSRGLDIDRPNRYGRSALFLAIDNSLRHLLPVLLKHTKNIDYVGFETRRTLLHIVLGNKAKTSWPPSYSQRYSSSIVKILLDRGVSPEFVDKSLNTALHLAIADYDGLNVVQMLINHTRYFNQKNDAGETPLSIAIREGLDQKKQNFAKHYRKICQSLMMKGDAVDDSEEFELRPLHIFAKLCNRLDGQGIELFEMLISIGCDVNAKNLRGETPLHIAVASRNMAVVQKLIESGAQIHPKDAGGATPLHLAISNEADIEIAKVLIKGGANVNAKDCKGYTALHKAAGEQDGRFQECTVMKLLLEHGADFCALSDKGYSVLYIGVWTFDRSDSKIFDFDSDSDLECNDTRPLRLRAGFEVLELEEISKSRFFSSDCFLPEELEFLLNHWVKLYAAKLDCCVGHVFNTRDIKGGLGYFPESYKVYRNCMKEIDILKNTFIDNNRTSIYDFLRMNLNSRRAHVLNKQLKKFLRSRIRLEKQFPQYATLIFASYNEAITRKSLINPAKKAWIKLNKTHLGDLCIEHIFYFLSNAELYDLIEASEINHSR